MAFLAFLIAYLGGADVHSSMSPAVAKTVIGLVVLATACMAVLGAGLLRFREWARRGAIVYLLVGALGTTMISGVTVAKNATRVGWARETGEALVAALLVVSFNWLLIYIVICYMRKDRVRALFSERCGARKPYLCARRSLGKGEAE